MGLATEIVKFFQPKNLPKNEKGIQPTSIKEFIASNNGANLLDVVNYCNILESKGILMKIAAKDQTLLGPCYISKITSQKNESNEAYDLLCKGFLEIRKKFQDSVYPIIATQPDDSLDIGTAFYAITTQGLFMFTAFHCIEGMKNVKIPFTETQNFEPLKIYKSQNRNVDIAAIQIGQMKSSSSPFVFGECEVLDEIMTIGYPPIPGFDAFQIAELATINSTIKTSKGSVIGNEKSYLDKLDYLLINARVKGGNSGSPIINKYGYVCGVLVNIPTDPKNRDKLDELGYGLGLGSSEMNNIIKNIGNPDQTEIEELKFEVTRDGFYLS